LGNVCAECGAGNAPGAKFCGDCGAKLSVEAVPAPAHISSRLDEGAGVVERRLVSVLFTDLVGFTSMAEHRDAEEVRELLTRYFDAARRLVERYGGTVEKFIGDAVMAVWGAPVAQEDDAERAVRTALDLVAAVSALGDEYLSAELRLRAGVMTGEVAVTVGAVGQGMVAGDLVNAASRVQALAAPGAVYVDDVTRRATQAAIAYEDVGMHRLKGKTTPIALHAALRVIAARRGEGRSAGLEPPFIGRGRDFRLVKDLFHATADERRARLVSVSGVAGVGKSRLAWEFEKYIDGLADDVFWHRGRCLAYGDGIAYWALGEMVRMRARIAEDDQPEVALFKLRETLEWVVADDRDRAFLEPRLAHLIGLAERTAPDKEDLFSAWRLFFERLADRGPVVMVFEDLQWADAGLLDFIEYLLDWSRSYPLYLLTVSRPDLAARRPSWGAGRRDFTSIFLEPIGDGEMSSLLDGLVPGLPGETRQEIVARADGVPLYAVETVRMLLGRGALTRAGDGYRLSGPIEGFDVPETLHALVAARLDGLEPEERALLSDAAVLGKSFTRDGLMALSGRAADALEPVVISLLRKEFLTLQSDRLSPERGQLAFVQDLLRRVAYDTMSKGERKARHLAAAAHLQAEPAGDDELAGVVASHYLDAYRSAERDPDAADLKERARSMLVRAGERAASLAAGSEAAAYLSRAVELCDDPEQRAELLDRVGAALIQAGATGDAVDTLQNAVDLLAEVGASRSAARVAGHLAEALWFNGRANEALGVLRDAYATLASGPHDADLAAVAAEYSRIAFFLGDNEAASEPMELALDLAEALNLPQVLAEALNTKGVLLYRRATESEALIRQSIRVAVANDLPPTALRAQYNLAGLFMEQDRYLEAIELLHEALDLARRRGYRTWEAQVVTQLADSLSSLGRWDEAIALVEGVPGGVTREPMTGASSLLVEARVALGRGTYDRVSRLLEALVDMPTNGDRQDQTSFFVADAIVSRANGRYAEAITSGRQAFDLSRSQSQIHYGTEGLVEAVEAAFHAGDLHTATELLEAADDLERIEHRPFLDAQVARLKARLATPGNGDGDRLFTEAITGLRKIDARFWLAVALLEYGESLTNARPYDAERYIAESKEIFLDLEATCWLDRAGALSTSPAVSS